MRGFSRSIDLQWILVGVGSLTGLLSCLVPDEGLATLLVLARFDSIETLPEPGFLGPLPVLILIGISIRGLHDDLNGIGEQASYHR